MSSEFSLQMNELVKMYTDSYFKKIKLIQKQQENIEEICKNFISPIHKFHSDSLKELQKYEDFYLNSINQIRIASIFNNFRKKLYEFFFGGLDKNY
jgi:hypothetical protein